MESSEESLSCVVTNILDDDVEDAMLCVEEVILAVTNVLLMVLWERFSSKDV